MDLLNINSNSGLKSSSPALLQDTIQNQEHIPSYCSIRLIHLSTLTNSKTYGIYCRPIYISSGPISPLPTSVYVLCIRVHL